MENRDLLLSIDNGTQSLKALLFDPEGRLVGREQIIFERPYYSEHPGWAEQDPAVFWHALCLACQNLLKQADFRQRIAGVSITTQRSTIINVDKNGKPLRPAIVWLDQRKTYGLPPICGIWGLLFKITGLADTISYLQSEAEANWIITYQPDIWEKTHKYLLLSGYLTYLLTGEFSDSIGCQAAMIPFDYKNLHWASSWNWKWKVAAVKPEMLPRLIAPGQPLGKISRKAAEETGIPEGLPLIAAATDKACEVIGSGSLDSATGCLSYGTTATINVNSKKYVEPVPLFPPYPSAVPNYYNIEVQIYRGFWMVNWFKEEFGWQEQQEASLQGVSTETLFDKMIDNIPPGSMGLVLQPYWSPGLKLPGPEAKGAIIGFGDVHTRGHVYRAILEGLGYALREGKERIERRAHIPITSLVVSGGGSQSNKAMQVTADIFGLPTARPSIYDTSSLGAAIDAAVGLGIYSDFKSAIKNMTHIGDVFEPNRENGELYDQLYRDVYKKMYRHLRPMYQRIRGITGYPR